jgi:3-deoxy-D-arabino-heptulosonate 7-phosphate (DAHP) synthase
VVIAKPWIIRKSPYSFRGSGLEAFEWLIAAKQEKNVKIILNVVG